MVMLYKIIIAPLILALKCDSIKLSLYAYEAQDRFVAPGVKFV